MTDPVNHHSRTRFQAVLLVIFFVLAGVSARAEDPQLQFTQISSRTGIVDIANAGDGSGRLFLVEQRGRIFIHVNGETLAEPFLNISGRVGSMGNEQGLLSVAFAPDYETSGYFYVWYTGTDGGTALARYTVSGSPNLADPNSFQLVLVVPQPLPNHNGGRLQFGPDGMLYLGLGDGGGSGDPDGNSQDSGTLLGKLIRIDVDPAHGNYAIPPDNPFLGDASTEDEIWALGLRNPWRISFDRETGDLYIADVGQNQREEVNFQAVTSSGGENYGWDVKEGSECVGGGSCDGGFTDPVAEYTHEEGCSITGGEVYRGELYPNMEGLYFYGDWCTGKIWGLSRDGGAWTSTLLADTPFQPTTFGLDEAGNIYLASNDGIYLVSDGEPAPPFTINAGLNDAWYNRATDGQGFLISVFEGTGVMFVAWFTYDTERPPEDVMAILGEPGHRWLTAQGTFSDNVATLDIYLTAGGVFDSGAPPVERTPYGTMTITWADCNSAVLTYDIPSPGLMGEIPIERVVSENAALCEALL